VEGHPLGGDPHSRKIVKTLSSHRRVHSEDVADFIGHVFSGQSELVSFSTAWGILGNFGEKFCTFGEFWGILGKSSALLGNFMELWGILGNFGEFWGIYLKCVIFLYSQGIGLVRLASQHRTTAA
jgi:hypothetical protein